MAAMFEDFRLRIFLTLAGTRSFTAAAKELGISQPAVSQNISELERTLGEQLFERKRGEASLTDKGLLFKGYAEQILHWYGAAVEAVKTGHDAVTINLDESSDARIWTSGGDIHISFSKK